MLCWIFQLNFSCALNSDFFHFTLPILPRITMGLFSFQGLLILSHLSLTLPLIFLLSGSHFLREGQNHSWLILALSLPTFLPVLFSCQAFLFTLWPLVPGLLLYSEPVLPYAPRVRTCLLILTVRNALLPLCKTFPCLSQLGLNLCFLLYVCVFHLNYLKERLSYLHWSFDTFRLSNHKMKYNATFSPLWLSSIEYFGSF